MSETTIPDKHLAVLGAVYLHGRPGDYSQVYEALPGIPPQTIRTIALKYGKGLGEPRKHPRASWNGVELEISDWSPEGSDGPLRDVGDRLDVVNLQDGSPVEDLGQEGEFVLNPPAPAPERLYLGQDMIGCEPDDRSDIEEAAFQAMVHPGPEKSLAPALRPFYRELAESTRMMVERLGYLSPRWPEPPKAPAWANYGAVVGLADIHLGKLAWARETGHDYDLAIGDRIFRNGVIDLCERVNLFGVEELVAPIGNDFFHFDNLGRTTTKGTLIDSDGRYPKVFHRGYEACCFAVEVMRSTGARVVLKHIPGNHDRLSSWHLIRELWLTFRNAEGVEIDMEPTTRKYHEYGANLYGFDHGEKVSERDLPALMAMECREKIAGKKSLEWFIGHHHRSKRTHVLPEEDTMLGCAINWMPSLCGADSFLFEQGYIRGGRAARAYLFDRDNGRSGYFEVAARES